MQDFELGLCDEPARIFLYIAQDESGSGACWYRLDRTRNPPAKVFEPQRAIRGYISGLRVAKVTTEKHGDKDKLDIFMNCGERTYAIRAGVETVFARGVLLSLLAIEDPEVLKGLLTIVAAPSKDNAKIVFGQVFITTTAQRVPFEWDKHIDLRESVTFLQTVLGDAGQSHDDEPRDEVETVPDDIAEGDRHKLMVAELTRCGVLAGLAHVGPDSKTDLTELNKECARLYKGKTIDKLTREEGIAFRKTLMAI